MDQKDADRKNHQPIDDQQNGFPKVARTSSLFSHVQDRSRIQPETPVFIQLKIKDYDEAGDQQNQDMVSEPEWPYTFTVHKKKSAEH